jgi:hypothetical protein
VHRRQGRGGPRPAFHDAGKEEPPPAAATGERGRRRGSRRWVGEGPVALGGERGDSGSSRGDSADGSVRSLVLIDGNFII